MNNSSNLTALLPDSRPKITLIAAIASNGVIGRNNRLPWRLPDDLKRFKALTMGHPIIMGRRTFESLGKLLPGRTHITVTTDPLWHAEGAMRAASLLEAITLAGKCEGGNAAYVIGGAQLYASALALADRLELTEIDASFEGDTTFPEFDRSQWRLVSRETHQGDEFNFSFASYARV